MSNKNYKVHNNAVYELQDNDLYTTYSKCKVPEIDNITPTWKGSPIPFQMWQDITDWCVLSYEKFKSETLVFLYYDLNNKKNPWSFWIPPQITNGMTVKSNPESEFFEKERKNFPDTMFGTVHHHCSSSAFQSGTDHSDELDREGLHFTIGNLNTPFDLDVHVRITIGKAHGDANAYNLIEANPKVQKSFESLQPDYHIKTLKQAFDTLHESSICSASKHYTKREKEFAKHYKKVEKPSYSNARYSQGWSSHKNNNILGSQFKYQNTLWDEWDKSEELVDTTSKKKEDNAGYDDIATDLIDNFFMTRDIDELRMSYVNDTADLHSLPDKVIIPQCIRMLEDEVYSSTLEGLQFHELYKEYLLDEWSNYVVEHEPLVDALQELSDEQNYV